MGPLILNLAKHRGLVVPGHWAPLSDIAWLPHSYQHNILSCCILGVYAAQTVVIHVTGSGAACAKTRGGVRRLIEGGWDLSLVHNCGMLH